jgi:hypothetical protein
MKAGDLVIVTSFAPHDGLVERLAIYIDDGVTNGAHSDCWVLTSMGLEEVNSYFVFPVERPNDQSTKNAKRNIHIK